jgi:uncharacterized membrane-anchored protein
MPEADDSRLMASTHPNLERSLAMTSRPPGVGLPPAFSKVPHVTLAFWIAKILAATVGETAGDALSMTLHLGYAVSTLIFLACFFLALGAQVVSTRYDPLIYWVVFVATTTVGTTASDFLDRTAGWGYANSSGVELALVLALLVVWRKTTGSIAVDRITTRANEIFYWATILVSKTLGTALGDFVATSAGLGFERSSLLIAALVALIAGLHFFTDLPTSLLFWTAYILTCPFSATLGDTLTKPRAEGGLDVGRITTSLVIAVAMIFVIAVTSLRRPMAAAEPSMSR